MKTFCPLLHIPLVAKEWLVFLHCMQKRNRLTTAADIAGAPPNLSYRVAAFSEGLLAAVVNLAPRFLAGPGRQ